MAKPGGFLFGLGVVADAYFSLHPEKKNAETVYCFFDEIQVVPGWEPFVERLIDFRGIDGAGPLSTRRRLLVRKAFDEYWERGGFPEVAGLDRTLRVKVHQEYWGAMLFRDLVERHDVSLSARGHGPGPLAGGQHRFALLRQPAHRLSAIARTPSAEVGRVRLPRMVRGRVPGAREHESQEGLLRRPCAGAVGRLGNTGQRRPSAREPGVHGAAAVHSGFVARMPDGSRALVQVCESLANPGTRKREVTALTRAMAELGLRSGTIVTRDEQETVPVDAGAIEIVPAWRFLLDRDG